MSKAPDKDELQLEFSSFQGDWDHLAKLVEGVVQWNTWRAVEPSIKPDLRGLNLQPRPIGAGSLLWTVEQVPVGTFLSVADLERADLRGALLQDSNLESCLLNKANLSDANLENADLQYAQLNETRLAHASLRKANLSRAQLHKAILMDASLEHAVLYDADLTSANFVEARLDNAVLKGSSLGHAILGRISGKNLSIAGTHMWRANLGGANLEGADFQGADVWQARFAGANLSNADLRLKPSRRLRLDDTKIYGARFGPAAADPWSVVRRTYSGPALLFHLLFLVVFFLPYLGKAFYWKGVSQGQDLLHQSQLALNPVLREIARQQAILEEEISPGRLLEAAWLATGLGAETLTTQLSKALLQVIRRPYLTEDGDRLAAVWREHGPGGELPTDARRALAETARQWASVRVNAKLLQLRTLTEIGPCLQHWSECSEPLPLVVPLLGLDKRNLLWGLPILLLIYNLFRGVLTWWVSRLRDGEERSGWSPKLVEYLWVYYFHHYFMRWIPAVAFTGAAFQLIEWLLLTEVVLPK